MSDAAQTPTNSVIDKIESLKVQLGLNLLQGKWLESKVLSLITEAETKAVRLAVNEVIDRLERQSVEAVTVDNYGNHKQTLQMVGLGHIKHERIAALKETHEE